MPPKVADKKKTQCVGDVCKPVGEWNKSTKTADKLEKKICKKPVKGNGGCGCND